MRRGAEGGGRSDAELDAPLPNQPLLIIFGGRSGAGKTTLARALSARLGAVFLRIDSIDSIEQAILRSSLRPPRIEEAGYLAAHAVAEDNLRLGRTVVADSVNPLAITRAGWRAVAERAGSGSREVEVVCSNADEHRKRVDTRGADIPGPAPPGWSAVIGRAYEALAGGAAHRYRRAPHGRLPRRAFDPPRVFVTLCAARVLRSDAGVL